MKDLTNINNNHEFEDIEQLLQPQCDFMPPPKPRRR